MNQKSGKEEVTSKQAFFDKKEYDREVRKLENKVGKTEEQIEKLEKEIESFEKLIADPSIDPEKTRAPGFYSNYSKLQAELKQHMNSWEQLQTELEHLKNKRN